VRRPSDEVDGGGVQGDFVDLLPGGGLFAPDDDFAVVRRGCEDVAVLRMRPCYAPNRAFMPTACQHELSALLNGDVPSQRLHQCVLLAVDLEDLDGLVRGACR